MSQQSDVCCVTITMTASTPTALAQLLQALFSPAIDPRIDSLVSGIDGIRDMLTTVLNKESTIMANLDALTQEVTDTEGAEDSATTLLIAIEAEVAALAPNQAAIDGLVARLSAKRAALAAAVAANPTPAPAP